MGRRRERRLQRAVAAGAGIEAYYGLNQPVPDFSAYTEGYRAPRDGSSLDALLTRQRARLGPALGATRPERAPQVYQPVLPEYRPLRQLPPITMTTPGVLAVSRQGGAGVQPDQGYVRPGFPERLDLPIPWSQTFDALGQATTGILSGDTGALIGSAPAAQRGGVVEGPFGIPIATMPITASNFATYGWEGTIAAIRSATGSKYQQPPGWQFGDPAYGPSDADKDPLDSVVDAIATAGDALWNASYAPVQWLKDERAKNAGLDVRNLYATGRIGKTSLLDAVSAIIGGRDTMASIAAKAAEKGQAIDTLLVELYDLDPEVVAQLKANPRMSDADVQQLVAGQPFSRNPFINLVTEFGLQIGMFVLGGFALKGLGLAGRGAALGARALGAGEVGLAGAELTGAAGVGFRVGQLAARAGVAAPLARPALWASRGVTAAWRVNSAMMISGVGIRAGEWSVKQVGALLGDEELIAMADRWLYEMPLSGNPGLNLLNAFSAHPIGFGKTLLRDRVVSVGQGPGRITLARGRYSEIGGRLVKNDPDAGRRLIRLAETVDADALHRGFFARLGIEREHSMALFGDTKADATPGGIISFLLWHATQQVRDELGEAARRLGKGLNELERNELFWQEYGGRAVRLLERTLAGKDTALVDRFRDYYWNRPDLGEASTLGAMQAMGGAFDPFVAMVSFRNHYVVSKAVYEAHERVAIGAELPVVPHVGALIPEGRLRELRGHLARLDLGPDDYVPQRELNLMTIAARALRQYGEGRMIPKQPYGEVKITRRQLEALFDEAELKQAELRADLAQSITVEPRENVPVIDPDAYRPGEFVDEAAVADALGLPPALVNEIVRAADGAFDIETTMPSPALLGLASRLLNRSEASLMRTPALAFEKVIDWFDETVAEAVTRGTVRDTLSEFRQALEHHVTELGEPRAAEIRMAIDNLLGAVEKPIAKDFLRKHPMIEQLWDESMALIYELSDNLGAWLEDPLRGSRILPVLEGGVSRQRLFPPGFMVTDLNATRGAIGRFGRSADVPEHLRASLADPELHPFEKLRLIVAAGETPGDVHYLPTEQAVLAKYGAPLEQTFEAELTKALEPDVERNAAAVAQVEEQAVAHEAAFADLAAQVEQAARTIGGERPLEGADLTSIRNRAQQIPGFRPNPYRTLVPPSVGRPFRTVGLADKAGTIRVPYYELPLGRTAILTYNATRLSLEHARSRAAAKLPGLEAVKARLDAGAGVGAIGEALKTTTTRKAALAYKAALDATVGPTVVVKVKPGKWVVHRVDYAEPEEAAPQAAFIPEPGENIPENIPEPAARPPEAPPAAARPEPVEELTPEGELVDVEALPDTGVRAANGAAAEGARVALEAEGTLEAGGTFWSDAWAGVSWKVGGKNRRVGVWGTPTAEELAAAARPYLTGETPWPEGQTFVTVGEPPARPPAPEPPAPGDVSKVDAILGPERVDAIEAEFRAAPPVRPETVEAAAAPDPAAEAARAVAATQGDLRAPPEFSDTAAMRQHLEALGFTFTFDQKAKTAKLAMKAPNGQTYYGTGPTKGASWDAQQAALRAYLDDVAAPAPVVEVSPRVAAYGGRQRYGETSFPDPYNETTQIPATFRVIEVDDLTSSDLPEFDQSLQPRERALRRASDEQVVALATDMTERAVQSAKLLLRTESGAQGALVTDPRGMVIAGNGRTMAMRQAGPAFWREQRKAIKGFLATRGLMEEKLPKRPVLVREVPAELASPELAAALNVETGGMAISEQGARLARQISAEDVRTLDVGERTSLADALTADKNAPFVQRMLGILTERERASFLDATGKLNQQGVDLISASLLSKLMRDPASNRLVARFFESADDDFARLRTGMLQALAQLIEAHELPRYPQLAIGDAFARAVDMIDALKRQPALNRADIELALDPIASPGMFEALAEPFEQSLGRVLFSLKSADEVTTFLRAYAKALADSPDPNQVGMFVTEAPARATLANAALKAVNDDRAIALAKRPKGELGLEADVARNYQAIRGFPDATPPFDTTLVDRVGPTGERQVVVESATAPAGPQAAPGALRDELAARLPEGGELVGRDPNEIQAIRAMRGGTDLRAQYLEARRLFMEADAGPYYDDLIFSANQGTLTPGEFVLLRELSGGLIRRNEAGELNMRFVGAGDQWASLDYVDQLRALAELPEGPGRIIVPEAQQVDPNFVATAGFTPEPPASTIGGDAVHTVLVDTSPHVTDAAKAAVEAPATPSGRGTVIEFNQPEKALYGQYLEAERLRTEAEIAALDEQLASPELPAHETTDVARSRFTTWEAEAAYGKLVTSAYEMPLGPRTGPYSLGEVMDALASIDSGLLGDAGLTIEEVAASNLRNELLRLADDIIVAHGGPPTGDPAIREAQIRRLLAQARKEQPRPGDTAVPVEPIPAADYSGYVQYLVDALRVVVEQDPATHPLAGYGITTYNLGRLPTRSKLDRRPLSPRLIFRDDLLTLAEKVAPGLADELLAGRQRLLPQRIADSKAGQFFDLVFGPRSEREIHQNARAQFAQGVIRDVVVTDPLEAEYISRDLSAVYRAWEEDIGGNKVARFQLRRRVGFMDAERMIAVADRTMNARHANSPPEWYGAVRDSIPERWRAADNRIRGYFAGQDGGLAKFVEAMYGGPLGRRGSPAYLGWTVLYHTYRFLTDLRWLGLELIEAPTLVLGRAGPRAALETVTKRGLEPQFKIPFFGTTELRAARENYAWWLNQTDPGASIGARNAGILRIMQRESPERLEAAVIEYMRADPEMLRAMTMLDPNMTPEGWVRRLSEDYDVAVNGYRKLTTVEAQDTWGPFLERGVVSQAEYERLVQNGTYYTIPAVEQALAETIGNPAIGALVERLHVVNQQLWQDVAAMMFGQPDRSNFQRFLNHPLLFWPLSYQIKATKWLGRVLLERAGGLDTGAAGLVLLDQVHAQHQQRLANEPDYQQFFQAHKDLFFLAQMLIPVTPWDIGVSLSPWTRIALHAGEADPYVRNIFGIGPGYSYFSLLPRLAAAETKEGGIFYGTPLERGLQTTLPATYTIRPKRADSQLQEAEERVYQPGQFELSTPPDTGSEVRAPYYQPPTP